MDVTLVSLPKSVENLQLPDPALVQYYSDLENRIIWLDDEVGEDTLYITTRGKEKADPGHGRMLLERRIYGTERPSPGRYRPCCAIPR